MNRKVEKKIKSELDISRLGTFRERLDQEEEGRNVRKRARVSVVLEPGQV